MVKPKRTKMASSDCFPASVELLNRDPCPERFFTKINYFETIKSFPRPPTCSILEREHRGVTIQLITDGPKSEVNLTKLSVIAEKPQLHRKVKF